MVELNRIAEMIETTAPLDTQEAWDNSGWQIFLGNIPAERVLTALELTEAVAEEAAAQEVQLIVCHHPLFFTGMKSVDTTTAAGRIVTKLIRHGISVYATHTPFDKCRGGNNDYLASLLQLTGVQQIPGDESGICRMGNLPQKETVKSILETFRIKTGQNTGEYRIVGNPLKPVDRVGLCTGAGSAFAELAADAGCGLFITGDIKYHEAQHVLELGMTAADIGHYGSEIIFTENMAQILRQAAGDSLEIMESQCNLNPFTAL